MEKVKIDKQFALKAKDFLKGAYVSVIAPIVLVVLEQFQIGNFNLDWKALWALALSTFVGYLLKNYFAPTAVVIEQPEAQTLAAAKDPDKPIILHPPKGPIGYPKPSPTYPDPEPKP